ncbi:hypothetical protein LEP1GSC186_2952 [Leptospira noguchii serovar Autumnalis str. ZUN142]|uniref:Uncharacterized protein n=1 Tax=Leptospira noguchii serovar Autumnalis str. ZUN142 TaxID=1085540 RepID=M6U7Y4_9LEPT|nr:hypothetical protein LEP1GSC186_2952 [Leptospira noguchii serovar Autumnalis str. ZUN142]
MSRFYVTRSLRNNLANLIASLLSVLILSELCRGIFPGATIVQFTPKDFKYL